MNLYRYRIVPLGGWRTSWQADTLAGRLCGVAAQFWGAERLQSDLLHFLQEGMPPFVVSDAFPGDLLPVPIMLRLYDWGETERKAVKHARWLSFADFERVRSGELIAPDALLPDNAFVRRDRLRNTISRQTGTTGANSLFSETEFFLNRKKDADPDYLSLYVRVQSGFESAFEELLLLLSQEGYGADASVGYGAFRIGGGAERLPEWQTLTGANGLIALSTFQPARDDPTDGFWEAFVKYGKLGPEFGLENVFKRPLVLLRPGACFRCEVDRPFLGRALSASEFLEAVTVQYLQARGVSPMHAAFGLTVPFVWREG
jgi:CRISPR-associated protein Csm4